MGYAYTIPRLRASLGSSQYEKLLITWLRLFKEVVLLVRTDAGYWGCQLRHTVASSRAMAGYRLGDGASGVGSDDGWGEQRTTALNQHME